MPTRKIVILSLILAFPLQAKTLMPAGSADRTSKANAAETARVDLVRGDPAPYCR